MARRFRSLVVVIFVLMVGASCRSLTGESLGENIDDTTITTTVKAKLAAEKVATLTSVGVSTIERTVYLTGVVGTPELKQRAESIARQVKGVKAVVNNLQVQQ